MTVFDLATLGGATQVGAFLFFVAPPMVAKASTVVTSSLKEIAQFSEM